MVTSFQLASLTDTGQLLAQAIQVTIVLVYYPPYHSKYNAIERCWGVLEVYWGGELLDSAAAMLGFAQSMTYAGKHPSVHLLGQTYSQGVRRSKQEMQILERRLVRLPCLPKWFVTIEPAKPGEIILPP